MAAKKITVSVISDLTTDQRVIRICSTLQNMGFDVSVIARAFNDSLPLGSYSFKADRIRCYFRKGVMQYAEFNFKLFFRLLFCKTDHFLANDLDTLIPNYIISRLRRKKLFYDTHEYFTGVPELRHSHLKRKFWKFFEDRIFPKLRTVYTVNDSVKEKYEQEYSNKISVIRNVPVTVPVKTNALPDKWNGKTILLLQGAGINEGRGGIELLEAMKLLPDNFYLVFIGSGNEWENIAQKRKEWHLEYKTEMMSRMPPDQLKQYTPLAHICFSLDSFDDLNCLFNLPNKVFDYIHAGVPQIATGIPEVKNIIEKYKCGICIDNNKPETIAKAIKELMADDQQYAAYKENCIAAAKELCWENESKKLTEIYQPFL